MIIIKRLNCYMIKQKLYAREQQDTKGIYIKDGRKVLISKIEEIWKENSCLFSHNRHLNWASKREKGKYFQPQMYIENDILYI